MWGILIGALMGAAMAGSWSQRNDAEPWELAANTILGAAAGAGLSYAGGALAGGGGTTAGSAAPTAMNVAQTGGMAEAAAGSAAASAAGTSAVTAGATGAGTGAAMGAAGEAIDSEMVAEALTRSAQESAMMNAEDMMGSYGMDQAISQPSAAESPWFDALDDVFSGWRTDLYGDNASVLRNATSDTVSPDFGYEADRGFKIFNDLKRSEEPERDEQADFLFSRIYGGSFGAWQNQAGQQYARWRDDVAAEQEMIRKARDPYGLGDLGGGFA